MSVIGREGHRERMKRKGRPTRTDKGTSFPLPACCRIFCDPEEPPGAAAHERPPARARPQAQNEVREDFRLTAAALLVEEAESRRTYAGGRAGGLRDGGAASGPRCLLPRKRARKQACSLPPLPFVCELSADAAAPYAPPPASLIWEAGRRLAGMPPALRRHCSGEGGQPTRMDCGRIKIETWLPVSNADSPSIRPSVHAYNA